jgi:hypothetical protein
LQAKEDDKLLMIITMWQLWTERNLIREEGRRRGAEFLFSHISLYAKEINDMKEGGCWTSS